MCNYSQYVFEKGFQEGLQRSIFGLISTLLEMGSQKDFIVSKCKFRRQSHICTDF